jgi:hypothetical protein
MEKKEKNHNFITKKSKKEMVHQKQKPAKNFVNEKEEQGRKKEREKERQRERKKEPLKQRNRRENHT